jgi:hypothetical protein
LACAEGTATNIVPTTIAAATADLNNETDRMGELLTSFLLHLSKRFFFEKRSKKLLFTVRFGIDSAKTATNQSFFCFFLFTKRSAYLPA